MKVLVAARPASSAAGPLVRQQHEVLGERLEAAAGVDRAASREHVQQG